MSSQRSEQKLLFSEFGTYNAIFLYKFWILCNFAGVTHSTIACLVVTDWKYTYISFLRTWTLSFKNYSQTHLASRVEDCHLWLYREKEALSVANPTERIWWTTSSSSRGFQTYIHILMRIRKSYSKEFTRPRCQSSLWMHGRQRHCLPCPTQLQLEIKIFYSKPWWQGWWVRCSRSLRTSRPSSCRARRRSRGTASSCGTPATSWCWWTGCWGGKCYDLLLF